MIDIEEKLYLQNKKKVRKLKEKGITLIALVVTIIILLILVGVTLSFALGENGIIGVAKKARKEQIIGETKEAIGLEITEAYTEATLRREELEKKQVEDIVNKYGKLQEDGDTIITKKDGYEISLKEIYSGVLSESGSYGAKVEQIEMLEKELEDLKENYTILEEANSGKTEGMKKLQEQIDSLTNEKNNLDEQLKNEQANNSTLQTKKAELEEENKELKNKIGEIEAREHIKIPLGTGRSINVKEVVEKYIQDHSLSIDISKIDWDGITKENFEIEVRSTLRGAVLHASKYGSNHHDAIEVQPSWSYSYTKETYLLNISVTEGVWRITGDYFENWWHEKGGTVTVTNSYLFL